MAEEGVKNPLASIPKDKRMYVYLGVGALGIVGYAWWRNSQSATADSETAMDSAYSDDGYVTQATPGDFWTGSGGGSASSDSGTDDGSGLPLMRTNAEWVQYAVEQLAAAGTDPTAAQSALGKYLDRQALNTTEQDYVRRALAAAGPPPVGTYVITPTIDAPAPSALAAPTGLKVTKVTSTSVDLSWNKVTGAGNYRVYRTGATDNVAASYDTVASIQGLQPNTSYTFGVAAGQVGTETVGPKSAFVTARTSKPSVAKPATPKASQITATSVYLTWTAVKGATGYRIFRPGNPEPIGASVDNKYRVNGLSHGKKYQFSVAAMIGDTTGAHSGYCTVTTKKK